MLSGFSAYFWSMESIILANNNILFTKIRGKALAMFIILGKMNSSLFPEIYVYF